MSAGEVLADSVEHDEGMYLGFNGELGVVVRYGYRELLRATFPYRPTPPAGECDWVGVRPLDVLATHGFLRAEAFGLLGQYLATGELPAAVARPAAEQPRLPGLEEAARPDEWWQVTWVLAGVV